MNADDTNITPAREAEEGWLTHEVQSPYQAGKTEIRILVPKGAAPKQGFPVVYVLPVEAARESRYGDGLAEVLKLDLHNQHRAIFVAPTFSHLPWYADHPINPELRQETYFLKVSVPFVEHTYPARKDRDGRLLLGFSKSGWGALSLLLRHDDVFGRAAAWDAPLAMDRLGKYGTTEIFGTQENFEKYRLFSLLRSAGDKLGDEPRIIITGYGNFRGEHLAADRLMTELKICHVATDGPQRNHDWHSGWVMEAAEYLLAE